MLSELDDWMSDDESDREDGEGEEDDDDQPKKKKKKVQSKGRTQQGKCISDYPASTDRDPSQITKTI